MNTIILAAAFGKNYELGTNSGVPLWNLPDEYNRFRKSIRSYPVIMGRKSYDVIKNPLEGSRNIVITRNPSYRREGVTVVHNYEDAVTAAIPAEKIYVIGGSDIFRIAIKTAGRLEVSRIDNTFNGADVYFPEISKEEWELVSSERHETDKQHLYPFNFEIWQRKA